MLLVVSLLSTAVFDDAKLEWLVQTVKAQSTQLDEQARQIAVQEDQLAILRRNGRQLSTGTWTGWTEVPHIGSSNDSPRWSCVAMSADGTKQTAVAGNGASFTTQWGIWTSTDFGATWTKVTNFVGRESDPSWQAKWHSVAMSADGVKQMATVVMGSLWMSTDSGGSWTEVAHGPSPINWRSIAMSADGAVMQVMQAGSNPNSVMWRTADSGATWSRHPLITTGDDSIQGTCLISVSRSWRSVAMSADGTKQTVGVWNGKLCRSVDSGATFDEIIATGNRLWEGDIAMSADGTIQTAGPSGGNLWTSTDTGITWTEVTSNGGTKSWASIAMSADGTIQKATVYGGNLWTSTDTGATWTEDTDSWGGTAHNGNAQLAMSADGTITVVVIATTGSIWTSSPPSPPPLLPPPAGPPPGPPTERTMWHQSILHKFAVPNSVGCGLDAELHTDIEPLAVSRDPGGNLTIGYSAGVAVSTPSPFTLTHHSGCASSTLSLQLDTVILGILTVNGIDVGAALTTLGCDGTGCAT